MIQIHAKRYKPARVRRPSVEHTVRLKAGQSLRLTLPEITNYGQCFADHDYHVDITGSFLALTEEADFGDDKRLIIDQVNVKPSWEKLSNLLLGNVRVYGKPKGGRTKKHILNVYVMLVCDNPAKQNIVTVVDSFSRSASLDQQLVNLEPDQILEVVVPDVDGAELMWRSYSFPVHNRSLNLTQSYHEYIPRGDNSGCGSADDCCLYCERRVYPHGFDSTPIFNEHHFFFSFKDICQESLGKLTQGVHPACRIAFIGKNSSGYVCDKKINVNISVKCEKKKKRKQQSIKQKLKSAAALQGHLDTCSPLARVMLYEDRKLINPNKTEQVFLYGQGDEFTVEIAQPSAYFPQAVNATNAVWQCNVKGVHFNDKTSHFISVSQMHEKWFRHVKIQRFKISLPSAPSNVISECVLGKLVLSCNEIGNIVADHERVLNVLLRRSELHNKQKNGRLALGSYGGNSNNGYKQNYNGNGNKQHYKKNRYSKYRNAVDYSDIQLTDVIISHNEDVLLSGEDTAYLSFEDNRLRGDYLKQDCYDYNDNYFLRNVSPKPKINADSFVEVNNIWLPESEAKKKRSLAQSASGRSQNETLFGKHANNGKASEKASHQNNQKKDEKSGRSILIFDEQPPTEVINPKHKQAITTSRGKPIIFHLLLPKGNYPNSEIRRQWTVNPINIMAREGCILYVDSVDVCVSSSGVPFQKVCVKPILSREVGVGLHRVGAIRFECAGDVKIVDIDVEVNDGEKRESLQYWREYWQCLRSSRPITFGKAFSKTTSLEKNRTTLIDPLGKQVDVRVNDEHELEIILTYPLLGNASTPVNWQFEASMLSGECEQLDSATHTLWDGDKVFRSLFKLRSTERLMHGELRILCNGEDQGTRIILFGGQTGQRKEKKSVQTKSKLSMSIMQDKKSIRIEKWSHGDSVVIFPEEKIYIDVPQVEDFLSSNFQHTKGLSNWRVDFEEISLEDEVWKLLSDDVKSEIDRQAPFFTEDVGFLYPGKEPWAAQEYLLKPIIKSQPNIYYILDALRHVHDRQETYPLAIIHFSYDVGNQFTVTRSINIRLGDPEVVMD